MVIPLRESGFCRDSLSFDQTAFDYNKKGPLHHRHGPISQYISVSICAWWSDIIDGESVSAVDFISEHGDILDVTEADVDIAPEAADGFIEGEGGGAGDEHQRFDGAVDEFDDLADRKSTRLNSSH